jgi:hypothetical protein
LEADGSVNRYAERLYSTVAAFIDVIGDHPLSYYLPVHIQQFATVAEIEAITSGRQAE